MSSTSSFPLAMATEQTMTQSYKRRWSVGLLFAISAQYCQTTVSLVTPTSSQRTALSTSFEKNVFSMSTRSVQLYSGKDSNNSDADEDESFVFDRTKNPLLVRQKQQRPEDESSTDTANYYMDDLTPPSVNFKRDSILFSENPSTKSNDPALKWWNSCKAHLPPVLTGAWSWRDASVANHNPIGALYNMAFVRFPVIVVGLVYLKNLIEGHPLIMNFGYGPMEMGPIVVLAVLALILA